MYPDATDSAMKKLSLLLLTAVLVAIAASAGWQEMPLEERFIRIQAAEAMPEFGQAVQQEPVAVQAVLLEYIDDQLLLLKAQAALVSQPELARRILPLYGSEPEFQSILKAYGDSIFLPIAYFLDNKIRTLDLRHYTAHKIDELKSASDRLRQTGNDDAASRQVPPYAELTAQQRGWYAVNFIEAEGHRFLGQFTSDIDGAIRWIQTDRLTDGVTSFFTDGIRSLETKSKTSQEVTVSDFGWAAVDALIFVSAAKVLRAGKTTAASSRSSAAAARLTRTANMALKTGKYIAAAAPVALVILAVRHPEIINDVFAHVAAALDLPTGLVQIIGWTLLFLPLFYLASWTLRWLVRPSVFLLRRIISLLLWFERRTSFRNIDMDAAALSPKT